MNHPPNILIVEDEPIIAGFIRKELRALGYHVSGHARSHREALNLLDEVPVDLALIDIALGGKRDGIDVAHAIRERGETPFIFLTSYADPATIERAKPTRPAGYVVKPFTADDLYSSIELALAASGSQRTMNDGIFLPDGYGRVRVDLDQILFFESNRMYLEIHTRERTHVLRSTLSNFLEKLPEDRFVRIHRSFAVQIGHVERWNRTGVWVNGKELPVGRTYQSGLMERLKDGG
jgi:DNA-binding LytR/AlgR family response regulator